MKKLKILADVLMVIGFIGFFVLVAICGSEQMSFGTLVISATISLVVCMGGWLGSQAITNEIEYREKNKRR